MEINDDLLDERIRNRITALDHVYPAHLPSPDLLWNSLDEIRRERKRRKHLELWIRSVAATVMILLIVGYVFIVRQSSGSDAIADESRRSTSSEQEQRALQFIEKYCAVKNISCQTPVIRDLRSDLEESSRKLMEINKQLRIYQGDAELIRARMRIERHQAQVIKTIIQTI